jgi:hypothetical protein
MYPNIIPTLFCVCFEEYFLKYNGNVTQSKRETKMDRLCCSPNNSNAGELYK